MSLIGDVLGDLIFEALGLLFWRLFHATGRRLIFLLTFGGVHVPSARGRNGDGWSDVRAAWAGFLFWLGIVAGALYWALA